MQVLKSIYEPSKYANNVLIKLVHLLPKLITGNWNVVIQCCKFNFEIPSTNE